MVVKPAESYIFPVGKNGDFEFRATPDLCAKFGVDFKTPLDSGYAIHGMLIHVLITGMVSFFENEESKLLLRRLESPDGVSAKAIKRELKSSRRAFFLAILAFDHDEEIDLYTTMRSIRSYASECYASFQQKWKDYSTKLFRVPVAQVANDQALKRIRLVEGDADQTDCVESTDCIGSVVCCD